MKINPFIFRAYDIRGVFGKDLTKEVFQKIGFIIGKEGEKILVGNDIRAHGKILAQGLISGLEKKKSKVFYCQKSSFGLCLFSGQKIKAKKIFFITASHLPSEWNGLKLFYGDGEPYSSKEIEKIKNEVLKIEKKEIEFKKPKAKKIDLKKEYVLDLLKKFPLLKKANLKIVTDYGNGSVSLVGPKIFKSFGLKIINLFSKPDPKFPNRSPEPTFEATKILRKKVVKEKADFGVAFDGDGDRGVIVDDKGRYLSGNQIGIILGKFLLKEEKRKKIVKTVACSMAVKEELEALGAKIIESPVGHNFVISISKKEKAILGIEESSHITMPKYYLFDDAILIPLKIGEILVKTKKKLSEIVDEIKIYPFEEIVFDCDDQKKFLVIEKLKEDFAKKYSKISFLDGTKISFDFGWALIRVSNTSPKVRLYLEAKTKEKLEEIKKEFSNQILTCIKQLC
jgi:phosphomannomutase / phosphoglucomutase